ncbi:hypothetical protein [Bosea sp. BIWAKO-01]|uniref:hypothetical protein n=1 Tax=Bosea sp. BIWAKO-01 TaxID=506668 RepID=UPI0008533B97|nr:hypothetical protein [Bosea sp. BIWAKO-01]GAU86474.1 hypothetical protein BIWAKO_06422 [Bosea sp. BIWAKO-01]
MSVETEGGRIWLRGRCGVEEAETLLRAVTENPGDTVVLSAGQIHTALWQVLMATRPVIEGEAPNDFSARFILPFIRQDKT